MSEVKKLNPLNAELNPICHLLALLGGATIVDVSRLRVKTVVHSEPAINKLGHGRVIGEKHENQCAVVAVVAAAVDTLLVFVCKW